MSRYQPNGTPISDYEREVLTVLVEECGEVIQAASKILRFGKEHHPAMTVAKGKEPYEFWQKDGHRIQRCDATTGHFVRTVALCEDEEIAQRLIDALATHIDPAAKIRHAVSK